MRLYYYTKLQYGLAAIRDKRIKISLYDSLNDPFDFLGLAIDHRSERRRLSKIKKELSASFGIVCLSETWKEPLMWGHYADSHRGICLGFEVEAGGLQRILYRKERSRLEDFGRTKVSQLTEEDKVEISRRKFDRWEYEREWRRVVALGEPDYVDNNYYLPFNESIQLKTVLFGLKASVSTAQVTQILADNPEARVAFTRPAFTSFDVVIDQNKTCTNVPKERRTLSLPVPESMEFHHALETGFADMFDYIINERLPNIFQKAHSAFGERTVKLPSEPTRTNTDTISDERR
ncbi:DUF2971 domain-containing protein [Agrobacterium sp. SORGH_AS 787]|uniref:DUF2971 domain-containing protein n=1 Tax=Agrobacterium sp. SORGH_AS 787 TaxID=3041775 RepID=UPI00278AF8B8|nr:hypothetical protein [Rhizobium sp. SORGH_AS_0787]